jgi:hypothetical protein
MFVVVTLTAGRESRSVSHGARVYLTPIVLHFAVVVVVSAIATVPDIPGPAVSAMLALCAVVGFAYSVAATIKLFGAGWGKYTPDWSDKCFYGFFPAIAYLGLSGAAGAIWLAPRRAAHAVGAIVLVLLLIGIRNAWDLATFLVQNAGERR